MLVKGIVYVNKVEQNGMYIYKIKKLNLIHDLEAAPTYVIE